MNVFTENESTGLIIFVFGAFVILFPFFWCMVVLLLSRIGGWHRLALRYAADDRLAEGTLVSPAHVSVGSVRYRYITTVQFANDGIFLDVMFLFRIGHPRLFIPYTEITSRRPVRFWWLKSERFTIGDPELSTITLPNGVIGPLPLTGQH